MSIKNQVVSFLERFNSKVNESGLFVIPTSKNRNELAMLAMTPSERKQIIQKLILENYCEGPMPDEDGSEGEVWVFGKMIQGVTIYIKLKLTSEAKCLSFHMAERTMKFPFKS